MVLLSREFGRNNDGENWPTLSWGTSTPHASGLGGQRMLVIPDLNIVAVFIGWNIYDFPSLDSWSVMYKLINAVER